MRRGLTFQALQNTHPVTINDPGGNLFDIPGPGNIAVGFSSSTEPLHAGMIFSDGKLKVTQGRSSVKSFMSVI